jgi:hypothetical protein
MTRTMIGNYTVDDHEHVTIEVVATKVGEFAKAALDGNDLNSTGNAPLKFEFDVDKSSGVSHFVVVVVAFDDTAPDDAKYQLFVQGSNGGGKFSDFTIPKASADLSRNLVFSVN